jgi:uncharacterized protein
MARAKRGAGQTALVTGASAGIGVDLAACFAKEGYDLILAARSGPALEAVAAELAGKHGVKATAIAVDLGAHGGGAKLAAEIAQRGLSVDVLVNNAGFGHAEPFDKAPLDTQLGQIDLNVRALVELTHIYWPQMLAKKRGGVINVASTAAFQPGPFMAIYYATKAFVLSFSEALWEEARGTGVHVSCLCPGATVSKFRERAGTDKVRLTQGITPMPSMTVARMGHNAFRRNRRVIVTGGRNAFMAGLVKFMPRTTVLGIVRNLQSPVSPG